MIIGITMGDACGLGPKILLKRNPNTLEGVAGREVSCQSATQKNLFHKKSSFYIRRTIQ